MTLPSARRPDSDPIGMDMLDSFRSSDGPIFLAGLSHSGKTPLARALSAHSRISMTRRTYMWTRYYRRFGDLSRQENLQRCISAMLSSPGILQLRPDVDAIMTDFANGEATYARLFALFHQQHAAGCAKARWGDQLGMAEAFADQILTAYPSAMMIHLVRDPRSLYGAQQRRGKAGWDTARWLYSADLATRNARRYPGRYLVVRYESFAARPEEHLREIALFLGEQVEDAMLEVLATSDLRAVTPSASAAANQAVGHSVADTLGALGYLETETTARRGGRFHVIDWPIHRMGMAAWSIAGSRSLARRARR
jgi:hypothetical protein